MSRYRPALRVFTFGLIGESAVITQFRTYLDAVCESGAGDNMAPGLSYQTYPPPADFDSV